MTEATQFTYRACMSYRRRVLTAYEKHLPPEWQRMRPRRKAMRLRQRWLRHAGLILGNRESRLSQRSACVAVPAELDAELARVSPSAGVP